MKLRIMGTREECKAFTDMILATVPNDYIRSISKWYQNNRSSDFSNEGRVYCDFKDLDSADLKLPEGKA